MAPKGTTTKNLPKTREELKHERPVDLSLIKLDDHIYCSEPNADAFYEAKIIKINDNDRKNKYKVHFHGWNNRYDRFFSDVEAKKCFITKSDGNVSDSRTITPSSDNGGSVEPTPKGRTSNKRSSNKVVESSKPVSPFHYLEKHGVGFDAISLLEEDYNEIKNGKFLTPGGEGKTLNWIILKYFTFYNKHVGFIEGNDNYKSFLQVHKNEYERLLINGMSFFESFGPQFSLITDKEKEMWEKFREKNPENFFVQYAGPFHALRIIDGVCKLDKNDPIAKHLINDIHSNFINSFSNFVSLHIESFRKSDMGDYSF
uniref:Tudor-knot domain-containing protein n=1 Tax=Parastrongyloides trichosuri TaxID=131310 RepID=A0A0N4ZT41_PARTI